KWPFLFRYITRRGGVTQEPIVLLGLGHRRARAVDRAADGNQRAVGLGDLKGDGAPRPTSPAPRPPGLRARHAQRVSAEPRALLQVGRPSQAVRGGRTAWEGRPTTKRSLAPALGRAFGQGPAHFLKWLHD